jgi:hypothetical protein
VNPPNGAQFYPFYTTGIHDGLCTWQEGGDFIPGTIDHFGHSSHAEYGSFLRVTEPVAPFTTRTRIQDFNSGDRSNPCPVGLFGHGRH